MKPSQKIIDVAVVLGIIIVLYLLYKAGHLLSDAGGAVKDVFGSGEKADKAKKKIATVNAQGSQSPFSGDYVLPKVNSAKTGVSWLDTLNNVANANKGLSLLSDTQALDIARKLVSTGGFLHWKEQGSTFWGLIKQLKNKAQVAQVTKAFLPLSGGLSIPEFLSSELYGITSQGAHNDLVAQVIDYVDKLPA